MKIKVKTFANLRDILGNSEIDYEIEQEDTLGNLLENMCQRYGKPFEHQIKNRATGTIVPFLLLINEKTFRSIADLNAPLNEGDVVTIMLPFDGG
ncbi:MAG: MoaD family protein [Deltaproteobacteria bacterium]|nr:MoaD family protein [Deltaproteobacteria bacterium]